MREIKKLNLGQQKSDSASQEPQCSVTFRKSIFKHGIDPRGIKFKFNAVVVRNINGEAKLLSVALNNEQGSIAEGAFRELPDVEASYICTGSYFDSKDSSLLIPYLNMTREAVVNSVSDTVAEQYPRCDISDSDVYPERDIAVASLLCQDYPECLVLRIRDVKCHDYAEVQESASELVFHTDKFRNSAYGKLLSQYRITVETSSLVYFEHDITLYFAMRLPKRDILEKFLAVADNEEDGDVVIYTLTGLYLTTSGKQERNFILGRLYSGVASIDLLDPYPHSAQERMELQYISERKQQEEAHAAEERRVAEERRKKEDRKAERLRDASEKRAITECSPSASAPRYSKCYETLGTPEMTRLRLEMVLQALRGLSSSDYRDASTALKSLIDVGYNLGVDIIYKLRSFHDRQFCLYDYIGRVSIDTIEITGPVALWYAFLTILRVASLHAGKSYLYGELHPGEYTISNIGCTDMYHYSVKGPIFIPEVCDVDKVLSEMVPDDFGISQENFEGVRVIREVLEPIAGFNGKFYKQMTLGASNVTVSIEHNLLDQITSALLGLGEVTYRKVYGEEFTSIMERKSTGFTLFDGD